METLAVGYLFTEGRLVARAGVVAIFTKFEHLTDPRIERTKQHLLLDMVAISVCAAICGANSWVDVEKFGIAKRAWFERFLELPHGIPSHDTLGRVFARLDTAEFLLCLQNWLRSLCLSLKIKASPSTARRCVAPSMRLRAGRPCTW